MTAESFNPPKRPIDTMITAYRGGRVLVQAGRLNGAEPTRKCAASLKLRKIPAIRL